jgi:hypothetical protein
MSDELKDAVALLVTAEDLIDKLWDYHQDLGDEDPTADNQFSQLEKVVRFATHKIMGVLRRIVPTVDDPEPMLDLDELEKALRRQDG